MAEQFKTIREVGIAIDGVKSQITSQFSIFKWVATGMGAAGGALAFALFSSIGSVADNVNKVSEAVARVDERQRSINAKLVDIDSKLNNVIARLDGLNGGINKINAGVSELLDCQKASYNVARNNSWFALAAVPSNQTISASTDGAAQVTAYAAGVVQKLEASLPEGVSVNSFQPIDYQKCK